MHVVNVFWRLAGLAVLTWMVVIGLAGCGPGVGGSGTGEESAQALAVFDAKAAAVCGTALASSLQCPVSGSAAVATDIPATTATFTDRATGGQVIATLQGDALELEARCRHLRFSGVWGVDRSGQARFYGFAVDDATGARVPAQVTMVAVTGGVQVMVLDAQGRELLGAVEMVPGMDKGAGGGLPACS